VHDLRKRSHKRNTKRLFINQEEKILKFNLFHSWKQVKTSFNQTLEKMYFKNITQNLVIGKSEIPWKKADH
jgi:hypothetical protein